MDAASGHQIHGRGAPRLLEHFALLERVTSREEPSARARLELELGGELADLLVGALARAGRPWPCAPAPACC
ncbi:MAG: hypothetical protein ACRDNI_09120 [Gaiellaceae bacterium]